MYERKIRNVWEERIERENELKDRFGIGMTILRAIEVMHDEHVKSGAEDEFPILDALEELWPEWAAYDWERATDLVFEVYACRSLLEHGFEYVRTDAFDLIMSGATIMTSTFEDVDMACSGVVEADDYESPDEEEAVVDELIQALSEAADRRGMYFDGDRNATLGWHGSLEGWWYYRTEDGRTIVADSLEAVLSAIAERPILPGREEEEGDAFFEHVGDLFCRLEELVEARVEKEYEERERRLEALRKMEAERKAGNDSSAAA